MEAAQRESRSFSFVVCRAIQRDLRHPTVTSDSPDSLASPDDELLCIREVARRLKLSVWTVRRRSRTPGDPLRLARSRVGKQKPMHFLRSRIERFEREGV